MPACRHPSTAYEQDSSGFDRDNLSSRNFRTPRRDRRADLPETWAAAIARSTGSCFTRDDLPDPAFRFGVLIATHYDFVPPRHGAKDHSPSLPGPSLAFSMVRKWLPGGRASDSSLRGQGAGIRTELRSVPRSGRLDQADHHG